jgi:DNA-directed RNA polymerase subunit F
MVKDIKPISEDDVKEELEKKAKKAELSYNEQLIIAHAEAMQKLGRDKKMLKKLLALLPEEAAIKIFDTMPMHEDTIKTILIHYGLSEDENKIKEILKIIKGEKGE